MTAYKPEVLANGPRANTGVTLLELMIVLVIVAILAGIGLPAYQQYARESKRTDAHTALLRVAALQEKFFGNNNQYAASTTTLGYAAHPALSNERLWEVSITASGVATYTLSAAPVDPHVDADCNAITMDSAGVKAPAGCW